MTDSWIDAFVPRRFQNAEFKSYIVSDDNKPMFDACKRYVADFSEETTTGLLLGGKVGVGKTHMMIAMGKNLAYKGYWCRMVNFARLCVEIKATWGKPDKHEGPLKDPLYSPILFLDDLGAEKVDKEQGGWVSEFVYDAIQYRYENMLPTVITTNLNLDDLAYRYTDRTASRLAELCQPIWIDGQDYRLKK